MKKGVYLILLAITIVVVSAFLILNIKFTFSPEEKACIDSGGTITTASCCGSIDAFPNTCTLGSCGCSPVASHQVKSCDCGTGKCFDGNSCVVQG